MLLASDQGIVHGYNNLADVCFLIATILFAIVFIVRLRLPNRTALDGLLLAGGFVALSLGFFVL